MTQSVESFPKVMDIQTDRPRWPHKIMFFIACVGMTTGVGNIWGYPYLSYKHGAGWIGAYLGALLVVGFPMIILEITLG